MLDITFLPSWLESFVWFYLVGIGINFLMWVKILNNIDRYNGVRRSWFMNPITAFIVALIWLFWWILVGIGVILGRTEPDYPIRIIGISLGEKKSLDWATANRLA